MICEFCGRRTSNAYLICDDCDSALDQVNKFINDELVYEHQKHTKIQEDIFNFRDKYIEGMKTAHRDIDGNVCEGEPGDGVLPPKFRHSQDKFCPCGCGGQKHTITNEDHSIKVTVNDDRYGETMIRIYVDGKVLKVDIDDMGKEKLVNIRGDLLEKPFNGIDFGGYSFDKQ